MVSKDIQATGDPNEEEEEEDDVDESKESKGMVSSSSKVEIDIFKYGSRVKQAVSSSFVSDISQTTTHDKAEKYKTASQMVQEELTILSIQHDNLMKEKKTMDIEKRQAEKTLT